MSRENPERPPVTLASDPLDAMSKLERIKAASEGLFYVLEPGGGRHPFAEEVDALTRGERPTLSAEAKQLAKFFGTYGQQARGERGRKTQDHFFMVRIKNPAGGELSASQWLALDEAADRFGDGTLRITSRQGLQYHHVYGPKLAPLIRHLNRSYREGATLGACGDVNRNVMTSPLDGLDGDCDPRGRELARAIADELAPRTSAYFEIWLTDADGRRLAPANPQEPLYGPQYLPRKFKVGIAHPQDNSVDLRSQDVGLMPVARDGRVDGSWWDLYSGGGMGLTHNNPRTAPLLGFYLGRIRREHVIAAVRGIATLQREHGERRDRRLARWKYTIRRLGLERVRKELRERFGVELAEAEPAPLPPGRVLLGWQPAPAVGGAYGLHADCGRLGPPLRRAVREIVERLGASVRLTPHQDLILCGVGEREAVERILGEHGIPLPERVSPLRRRALACPAKPTCGLAMTEAERVLPGYLDAIERAGLGDVDVEIRMTGCPNGCVRPPTAEIGIYGYGKSEHVVLVGGSREGTRIGRVLYPRVGEEELLPILIGLLRVVRDHGAGRSRPADLLAEVPLGTLRAWVEGERRGLQGG